MMDGPGRTGYSNCSSTDGASFFSGNRFFFLLWLAVFLFALYLRLSGLFRGLGDEGYVFHPDEAKQVLALFNFLNGDYVRYYGSLFYDGYPYGLNHLDEYILRPLLFLLGPDVPGHGALYFHARILRVVYGMAVMVTGSFLAARLLRDRWAGLLALFLLGAAPLAVTVSHFATGDIGVDLFTALCLLFLLRLSETGNRAWLVGAGFAVGAAFSAKYNGALLGLVPGLVLLHSLYRTRKPGRFLVSCLLLGTGVLLGVIVFTPNFLLDFDTTLDNMLANFAFIRDYNVPREILARPWLEKALLGLQRNTPFILSSLGWFLCAAALTGGLLCLAPREQEEAGLFEKNEEFSRRGLLLSLALYPVLVLFISLSGKYVVQPFHFSSLILPLTLLACVTLVRLREAGWFPSRLLAPVVALLLVFISGRDALRDNFFWRLEDTLYYEQNLPASLYDREAFYTHRSGPIRSLLLERSGGAVFRNAKLQARGPDWTLWNSLRLAPLPQVPNPVGRHWIFVNGPTFPRNDRMFPIHGEGHGKTVQRYLVLPPDRDWPFIGIRCGSFATEVRIELGGARATVSLAPHEQKTIRLIPDRWRTGGVPDGGTGAVRIVPLSAHVPHNDVWLTILQDTEEKELFTLFGGGQEASPVPPAPVPPELEEPYRDALTRIRYLEQDLSWRVQDGKRIPMWEVALPAGRYLLTAIVDGLTDTAEIGIELEDARGDLHRLPQQRFSIREGIQRIQYAFTKPFVPYQCRFVITSLAGKAQMLHFTLRPDAPRLSADFAAWRDTGRTPSWVAREADLTQFSGE
ncbi:MAG: hypothetical protein Kow0089_00410 [Desulfobulbaceae bacterium]